MENEMPPLCYVFVPLAILAQGLHCMWQLLWAVAGRPGIAYSGGGLPGTLNAMCAHQVLSPLAPPDTLYSTASGGTLGLLLQSASGLSYPPPVSPNLTADDLRQRGGGLWFARITELVPSQEAGVDDNWWRAVLRTAFKVYGVDAAPALALLANFAVVEARACPLRRDEGGALRDPSALHAAQVEVRSGAVTVRGLTLASFVH